jgi:hypothetical protein
MVVAVIGLIALVTSVSSWFPPGIAVGVALILLGVGLEVTDRRRW